MLKTTAIRYAGSGAALARLLGLTRAAVSYWPGPDVPELHEYRLRKLKPHWFVRERREGKA